MQWYQGNLESASKSFTPVLQNCLALTRSPGTLHGDFSNGYILPILLLLLLLLLLLYVTRASLLSFSPHIPSFLFLGCILRASQSLALSLGRRIHRSLGDQKIETCLHKLKTWCNIINSPTFEDD